MQHVSPDLELLLLCTKGSLPKSHHAKIHSILAMYGYTTLYQQETVRREMASSPDLAEYPYHLEIIVQNLHANIAEKHGVTFNLNILKAAKGLKRKLRGIDLRIASPQSLDNHSQYIENMGVPTLETIYEAASKNMSEFSPPYPIISTISNANSRTRVDKIRYKEGIAVCKTFRSTNLEGFKREIVVRNAIGNKIPEISKILESGENYFVMPLYESAWNWEEGTLGLFPLRYAEKCIDIVKRVNAECWSIIDWHPGNFIYGHDNQVIMIDLEAATKQSHATTFDECPDIVGHVDFPYQGKPINYANTWQPLIGLPIDTLLQGSPFKKSLRRNLYLIVKALPRWAAKKGEQRLRWLYRRFFRKQELYKHGSYFVFRF